MAIIKNNLCPFRLSWRQWKQDMSDKITTNVIDECNTHTMCVVKRFREGKNKTKQNKTEKMETKDQKSFGNFGFNVSFFVSTINSSWVPDFTEGKRRDKTSG